MTADRALGWFQAVVEATASYEWLVSLIEPLADRIVLAHPSPDVPRRAGTGRISTAIPKTSGERSGGRRGTVTARSHSWF